MIRDHAIEAARARTQIAELMRYLHNDPDINSDFDDVGPLRIWLRALYLEVGRVLNINQNDNPQAPTKDGPRGV